MSQHVVLTKAVAMRYQAASKSAKMVMLDELCATTGWHRDHARKALRRALGLQLLTAPRKPRPPTYGDDVLAALRAVWAVMDAPSGKRLAPFLPEITERMRAAGELDITDDVAAQLCSMSAATIDRRLAGDRRRLRLEGRSGSKPGTLLPPQTRTWSPGDEQTPGCVAIDCICHDGGDPVSNSCLTLTVTDIRTGWTGIAVVGRKVQKVIRVALAGICANFPFAVKGLDPGNEHQFLDAHALQRHGDVSGDGTRNVWSGIRRAVGVHRYDTEDELSLLKDLYDLLELQINFFWPCQRLVEKHRVGSRVTKRYDTAATPYQRVMASAHVAEETKAALTRRYQTLNPAQIQRDLHTFQDRLHTLAAVKREPADPVSRTP